MVSITVPAPIAFFNTRTEAMAASFPPVVNAIQTGGYTTVGDGGGASYKRVATQPTHAGKFQSVEGIWWELAEYEVTLEMFGGKADGVEYPSLGSPQTGTDNLPAFQAALGYGLTPVFNVYFSSATIKILRGIYYVSGTIFVDHSVRISGIGASAFSNSEPQSKLVFPENTVGFRFWSHNSTGGTGRSAAGSIIENVRMRGSGGTQTYAPTVDGIYVNNGDQTKHGIWTHTNIHVRNSTVENFAGCGIFADTITTAGSVNIISFYNIRLVSNGMHGLFIDGQDSNAAGGEHVDCSGSGGFGIFDSSLLNNTWTACHTNVNGVYARVYHNGGHWVCNVTGTLVEPGTDLGTATPAWTLYEVGGPRPHWFTWVAGNRYVYGGAYNGDHPSSRVLFLGCYSEGTQGFSRASGNVQYIGGIHATPIIGGITTGLSGFGQELSASGTRGKFGARMGLADAEGPNVVRSGAYITFGDDDLTPTRIIGRKDTLDSTAGLKFPGWDNTTGTYDVVHGSDALNPVVKFSSDLTVSPADAGRGAGLLPGNVMFPHSIFVGSTLALTRMISTGSAAPTVGPVYAWGDIVFNTAPVAGGKIGWVCVQGGVVSTVPTWTTGTVYIVRATIKNTAGNFYRIVFSPRSITSVVKPTHTFNPVGSVLADGYAWKQVFTVSAATTGTTATDWVTGTYALNALVKNPATSDVYKCITVGGGASTVIPAHTPTAALSDGYSWRYQCDTTTPPLASVGTTWVVGDTVSSTTGDFFRCLVAGAGKITDPPRAQFIHGSFVHADGYKWEYLGSIYTSSLGWEFGFRYLSNATSEAFAIVTTDGRIYKCAVHRLADTPSIVEPVHTGADVTTSDGYIWHYIGNTSPIWKTWGAIDP